MKESKFTTGIVVLALIGLILSSFTFAPSETEQKKEKDTVQTNQQKKSETTEAKDVETTNPPTVAVEEKAIEKTEVDLVKRVEYGVQVGNKVPEMKLNTLDGKEVTLSSLKGKKVILNFFASWCPYCQAEAGDLERIYKEYKEKNVEILLVDLYSREKSLDDVKNYNQKFSITSPILIDEKGQYEKLFMVEGTPTNVFVDSNGIIQARMDGAIPYSTIAQQLDEMK